MKTPSTPKAFQQATPDRPWLGLAHFTAADRPYFYGRDSEIRELTDRVRRAPLTVLYGVSGYGKSSILDAGLLPALEADGYKVTLLRRCYDDLDERPLSADIIAAVASDWGVQSEVTEAGSSETLWEFFYSRQRPWLQDRSSEDLDDLNEGGARLPVLLLDQFEEIFTKGEDRATGDATSDSVVQEAACDFLNQLADLVENRPPTALRRQLEGGTTAEKRALLRRFDFHCRPVRVAVALRDDFLARLERWRRAIPSMMEHRIELRLLTGPQAYLAVHEPGTKRPDKPPIIPHSVAEAIVRAAADASPDVSLEEIVAVPPILSLLCERLNDRRLAAPGPPDSIRATDFSPGEATRILAAFYEDKLRPHPRAVRLYLEDKLVSEAGCRENVTLDSALAYLKTRAGLTDAEARFRQLVDDRILSIEDRGGKSRVELTHDTLAKLALDRRAERESKRRRRTALAWVAVSLLVAGGALGLAGWAMNERALATREGERAEQAGAESRRDAASLLVAGGTESIRQGRWGDAVTQLAAAWWSDPDSEEANFLLPTALRQVEGDKEVIQAHTAGVSQLKFSPDKKWIGTASEQGQVKLWDAETLEVIRDFNAHGLPVRHLEFFDLGEALLLATAGEDQQLVVHDARDGRLLHRDSSHIEPINGIEFHPSGKQVLSWSEDATLGLHTVSGGEPAVFIQGFKQGSIRFACWTHQGGRILAVHANGSVTVWDAVTRELISEGKCFDTEDEVLCATIDVLGKWLAVGTGRSGISIWNVEENRQERLLKGESSSVWDLSFHHQLLPSMPNAGLLFLHVAYVNGHLERWRPLWGIQDDNFRFERSSLRENAVPSAVELSSDGAFYALADSAGDVRHYHAPTGHLLNQAEGHFEGCRSLAFTPDGLSWWTGGARGEIRRWTIQGMRIQTHAGGLTAMMADPTGQFILTGGGDGTAKLWNVASGVLIRQFDHAEKGTFVQAVAFDPEGSKCLTAGGTEVKIWSLSDEEKPIQTLSVTSPQFISDAKFVRDGTQVLLAVQSWIVSETGAVTIQHEDDGWRLHDVASGKEITRRSRRLSGITQVEMNAKAFAVYSQATDGFYFDDATSGRSWTTPASGSVFSMSRMGLVTGFQDGRVGLVDDNHRNVWETTPLRARVSALNADVEGGVVTAGDESGRAAVLEASSGETRLVLDGGSDGIAGLDAPESSLLLFSVSKAGLVHGWNRITGRSLASFGRHGQPVRSILFMKRQRICVTASVDGTLWLQPCFWEEIDVKPNPLEVISRVRKALESQQGLPETHTESPAIRLALARLTADTQTSPRSVPSLSVIRSHVAEGRWEAAWNLLKGLPLDSFNEADHRLLAYLSQQRQGLERVLFNHKERVLFPVAAGKQWLSIDNASRVVMWDEGLGASNLTVGTDGHPIWKAVVSPLGDYASFFGLGPDFYLHDLKGQKPTLRLEGATSRVLGGAFSQDGTRFYGAGYGQEIVEWAVPSGTRLRTFPLPAGTYCSRAQLVWVDGQACLLGPSDKQAVLVRLHDGIVTLYPSEQSQQGSSTVEHSVHSVTLTTDGTKLLLGNSAGVEIYEPSSGRLLGKHSTDGDAVMVVAFDEGSGTIIAGTSGGWVHSFPVDNEGTPSKAKLRYGGSVEQVEVLPGKSAALVGSYKSGVSLWSLPNLRKKADLEFSATAIPEKESRARFLVIDQGERIVTTANDSQIYIWKTSELMERPEPLGDIVSDVSVGTIAVQGEVIVWNSQTHSVQFFDAKSLSLKQNIPLAPEPAIRSLHATSDGGMVVVQRFKAALEGDSPDFPTQIVRLGSGALSEPLNLPINNPLSMLRSIPGSEDVIVAEKAENEILHRISPDGNLLWQWTAPRGSRIFELGWAAASTDGGALELLVLDTNGGLTTLDAVTGKLLAVLEDTGNGSRLVGGTTGPDGKRLSIVSANGTIRIWEVRSRRLLRTIHGVTVQPQQAQFSEDGRVALILGRYNDLEVWDLVKGLRINVVQRDVNLSRALLLTDGKGFVVGTNNGTVDLWLTGDKEPLLRKQVLPSAVVGILSSSPGVIHLLGEGGHTTAWLLPEIEP